MMAPTENNRYIVQVYVGALSALYEALSVEASKQTTSEEIVSCIVERLNLNENAIYELAEVIGDDFGQECKERSLAAHESPVQLMMLWPKTRPNDQSSYRFYLREKVNDYVWRDNFVMDPQLIQDYFLRFLYQPKDREYPDLCQLPDLNEQTLLDNLRARFVAGHIYTYVGSILIALNPFKFYPIYNPKYVKLYQNRRLGPNLPPHIFAVADTAYLCMLKDRRNQCIVISGESGSGKTESTNFLLHHLTALSQKGSHGSGVEQTILSAGPVLEAFGNAKTAHNNNSSRFGKFIQVNYKENGMVHGAVVQKYLLEKSRICTQGRNERNYHVFYYLLEGANEHEKQLLHLKSPDQYYYLNKTCGCAQLDNVDESYEFSRLKQSMEMVGFTPEKQRRLFSVLSAVLLLGNVEFQPRKSAYHHDEAVGVKNPEVVALISELLRVKQETLLQALTAKRARASGETLVINYRLPEAIASRDAMAKCLYGALFDWIVLQVNHALLSKKDTLREHQGNSIGVLDIFGFEDFGLNNSFEQLCINYANEHLQYYFNQHVFKYEQEEYRKEGIRWTNIDFMDNTGCLQLIEGKPNGLLCLLDDQCNFPGATNETLLQKFNTVHKENKFYKKPQKKEAAFIVEHYAGKVKYQVTDMREKNLDLMRQDIVGVLKNSSMAFVRELVGADPVAVFRWAIVRAFFRAYFAFHEAGRKHRQGRVDGNKNNIQQRYQRNHIPNENLISKQRITFNRTSGRNNYNEIDVPNHYNRLSWPQFYQRTRTINTKNAEEEHKRREPTTVTPGGSNTNTMQLEKVLGLDEARAIQRANQIVMKNKSFRPRERSKKGLKNLQSVKTLAGRTGITAINQGQLGAKARKQPQTVTAQFQQSLHSLMDTLNQANPFFIRCIKSNSNKIPNEFDDDTVQRQLRYTGMLETVRIRRAGFNVRLTYDEFIQRYRILLPKGLISSQNDVRDFLATLNLNRDNYQLGCTKVFLRESEKYKLDCKLHQQIMAAIVTLQRWFRACLERRRFLRIKSAVITVQSYCRMFLVQKYLKRLSACIVIQKIWRGYKCRLWYRKFNRNLIQFQAYARSYLARKRYAKKKLMIENVKRHHTQIASALPLHLNIKFGSSDEAFVSKESSQEELGLDNNIDKRLRDSDESSGIQEDDIIDTMHPKISVRSTVSLPCVSATNPTYFPYNSSNNRLDEMKAEPTVQRMKKINKTHKTIDFSDLDYNPQQQQRKGSGDSLTSQRSFESSDSHSSCTVRETSNKQDSFGKQWSSTSTTSDTYSEYSGQTLSAPPIMSNDNFNIDNNNKPLLSRTTAINYTATPPTSGVPKRNLQTIRRQSRTTSDDRSPVYPFDKVDKTTDFFGKPEAPSRQHRHQQQQQQQTMTTTKRSLHVKSLGDEIVDGNLHTIDEAKVTTTTTTVATPISSRFIHHEIKQSLTPKRQRQNLPTDLKRRNSDPATKATTINTDNSDVKNNDLTTKWSNLSNLSIAGHCFRKFKPSKDSHLCAFCCEKVDEFYKQGYKCTKCKNLFHTKCIQNKNVFEMPCRDSTRDDLGGKSSRSRKHRSKHSSSSSSSSSRTPYDLNSSKPSSSEDGASGKFNLTGTSEFTDRTDQIINSGEELLSMQDFIMTKIVKMDQDGRSTKSSDVDKLFKQALREFKDNLVQLYSAETKHSAGDSNIRYKDLILMFMQAMETVAQREQKLNVTTKDFPVTMGVNAFRGFMNEFMSTRRSGGGAGEEKPNKTKRKKDKKRKEPTIKYAGHTFLLTIINIPTACEICSSFIMWPIERSLVCQCCKLTCHKKCYNNATTCLKESDPEKHKVFGAPLVLLITEEHKIPLVIERLLRTIELFGLNTEGIYRKSGVTSKIKELKSKMDENPDKVDFDKYQVHVLASVLKSFLREMPEPLLTFECYENFITAANLENETDRVTTLYDILKKLPSPNYDLMERLMFHLARVALHEDVNRMSAASLAIVFAPCVLRTNKCVPAQESLHDISNQTQCIETIIRAQIRKVRTTLDDIDTLDTACQAANNRLSSLRSSKVFSPDELLINQQQLLSEQQQQQQHHSDIEEHLLVDHIQEIQKEKELLTSTLPTLTHATSDDDMLSTDGDGSLDDLSCIGGGGVEQTNKRVKGPIVRTISSSGGGGGGVVLPKIKRQSSSSSTTTNVVDCSGAKGGGVVEDCEDPIMV